MTTFSNLNFSLTVIKENGKDGILIPCSFVKSNCFYIGSSKDSDVQVLHPSMRLSEGRFFLENEKISFNCCDSEPKEIFNDDILKIGPIEVRVNFPKECTDLHDSHTVLKTKSCHENSSLEVEIPPVVDSELEHDGNALLNIVYENGICLSQDTTDSVDLPLFPIEQSTDCKNKDQEGPKNLAADETSTAEKVEISDLDFKQLIRRQKVKLPNDVDESSTDTIPLQGLESPCVQASRSSKNTRSRQKAALESALPEKSEIPSVLMTKEFEVTAQRYALRRKPRVQPDEEVSAQRDPAHTIEPSTPSSRGRRGRKPKPRETPAEPQSLVEGSSEVPISTRSKSRGKLPSESDDREEKREEESLKKQKADASVAPTKTRRCRKEKKLYEADAMIDKADEMINTTDSKLNLPVARRTRSKSPRR